MAALRRDEAVTDDVKIEEEVRLLKRRDLKSTGSKFLEVYSWENHPVGDLHKFYALFEH